MRHRVICPEHVRKVFNFKDYSIGVDVPLQEQLVESLREQAQWRVILTPQPGRLQDA